MKPRTIYWIVAGVMIALLAVMLVTWRYNAPSATARAQADHLIEHFEEAGLPTPLSAARVARLFGENGGVVCQVAGSDLAQGYLSTRLGVGGEFYQRPVPLTADAVGGLLLVVETYCPDKLAAAERYIDGLELVSGS